MRDRPPEIDDLEAVLEELGDIGGWEVAVHMGDGRFGGLVDMHSDGGLAGLRGVPELVWATAVDGWVS